MPERSETDPSLNGVGDEPRPTWYERNKEKAKARTKAWQLANPERFKELKSNWARKNRINLSRSKRLAHWRAAGVEPSFSQYDYDQLFLKQNGVCAICSTPPTPKRALSLDHEHLTGRVRGLLCGKCNLGIGYFKTLKLMEYAIKYMKTNTKGIQVPLE